MERNYQAILNEYQKLTLELWRIPTTRYFLGGVALAAAVPIILRVLKNYPEVDDFIRENLDEALEKVEDITHLSNFRRNAPH